MQTLEDVGEKAGAAGLPGAVQRAVRCCSPVTIACAALCLLYGFLFWRNLSPYWFNPAWTTDDALQQSFPFHKVYHPEVFRGDLITEAMEGYLAPLHYWLCYAVTWLTADPIMTCHWVMLVQIAAAVLFLFLAVRHAAGAAPAWLSVAWLLHTRPVMQRMTAGLTRGWAAPVIAAFLFFALTGRHKWVGVTILCGCLMHPPAALLIACAYGIHLGIGWLRPSTRRAFVRPLVTFVLLGPLYAGVTLWVVHRPDYMGQMVDYQTAAAMPEFQRPDGRFPFVPLEELPWDLKMYAYQPFFHRLYRPGLWWGTSFHPLPEWKRWLSFGIPLALCAVWLLGWLRLRRNVFPLPLLALFAAIVLVYAASRQFAFKLYVPNRHLQFPMTMFWIPAFCIVFWRGLQAREPHAHRRRFAWMRIAGASVVALAVYVGSGDGFYGAANFNYSTGKKGGVFAWVKSATPESALIAGHPTHIDALQLFGMRRAFATTETTHPFYPGYYAEMKRRLIISLRAHYARSLHDVVALLEPEGIDYFIFSRERFYPRALAEERYFAPLDTLVRELTSHDPAGYAYKKLPQKVDPVHAPYMPFRDQRSAVVDVKLLKQHMAESDGQGKGD